MREFSILGLASRTYQRRTFCRDGDCRPDQIDPDDYRKVSLGEHGPDRYMVLVPRTPDRPILIERVGGVTSFADVSPLNL